MIETYRNHSLLSNGYLTHHLPEHVDGQSAESASLTQELIATWERFTPRPGDTAHTRSAWVRSVLRALGYAIDDVSPAPVLHAGDPPAPVAAAIVCAWDQPLDQPPVGRETTVLKQNLSPAYRIHEHIERTGLPWGILTNGRLWRLYHRDTANKLDDRYEVELPALLEQARTAENNANLHRYFYQFFQPAAFLGEPSRLDEVLAASQEYERKISQNLTAQALQAFRLLTQGFLDFPTNHLSPGRDTLAAIHENSLITLYWLLFTLYAESRGVLPAHRSQAYSETYSLHALARRIAADVDAEKPAAPSMDEIWSYLRRLWHVLNSGNPDLGVPAHDGTLFDLARHPFLAEHRIGDSYLRDAVDLLARTEDPLTAERVFIDYGDLEIRHLGSIYENLLEYRLETRDQKSARENTTTTQSLIPNLQSPISNLQYPVSLVRHGHGRKSTGTFYTPDHIVQWLVQQTLGPILDKVRDQHVEEQPDGSRHITTSRQALIDDLLAMKVLDPAMGSGHFLVEVVDVIARYLVSLGLGPMDDLGDEAELTYWRRRVVQTCIYGVDVDPQAVELAKLSLWPMTAIHGKPLSFLEHHLRCGDSLIGSRMADLHLGDPSRREQDQREAGQLSMLDHPAFVESMRTATSFMEQIEAIGSETAADVHQASHLYRQRLHTATERYRILADIWTARHFGLQVGSALWSRLIPHVLENDPETSPHAQVIQRARDIAKQRHFFHWELEFPEVFFAPSPGFDAIVGNPPYLFGENVPADTKPFLRRHYDLAAGQFDVYWLFYERSFWLLNPGGRHGFIAPDAMLIRDEVEVLRAKLLEDYRVAAVAPVGRAFADPGVGAALLVWEKSPPEDHALDVWQHQAGSWRPARSLSTSALAKTPRRRLLIELDPVSLALVKHVREVGQPLGNFVSVSRGEEAGRRHLRPIHRQRTNDVPIVIGSDIAPLSPPAPSRCIADRDVEKEREIYRAGKLVIVKTGRDIVCTIDQVGHVTLQSVYNLNPHPTCRLDAAYLAALLSSALLLWYLRATFTDYKQLFPQINQSSVEELPIRRIEFTTPAGVRAALLEEGNRLYEQAVQRNDFAGIVGFIEDRLSTEPEQADVVHDVLAWLTERTIALNARRQRLKEDIDPFEYLDSDIACVPFSTAFADETFEVSETSKVYDLDEVYHDVDGLRLEPADDAWEVHILLKKRDPDDWRAWQYAEGGNRIAREWVPACRLALDAEKARYYQIAFDARDGFSNARAFPSGHTRTTWQKLLATDVPAFDPAADLMPLWERRRELADVEQHIEHNFHLIDQITYRLYRLSDADIANIE